MKAEVIDYVDETVMKVTMDCCHKPFYIPFEGDIKEDAKNLRCPYCSEKPMEECKHDWDEGPNFRLCKKCGTIEVWNKE